MKMQSLFLAVIVLFLLVAPLASAEIVGGDIRVVTLISDGRTLSMSGEDVCVGCGDGTGETTTEEAPQTQQTSSSSGGGGGGGGSSSSGAGSSSNGVSALSGTDNSLCGNEICDVDESAESCPADCASTLEDGGKTFFDVSDNGEGFINRITGAVVGAFGSSTGSFISVIFIVAVIAAYIYVRNKVKKNADAKGKK